MLLKIEGQSSSAVSFYLDCRMRTDCVFTTDLLLAKTMIFSPKFLPLGVKISISLDSFN